MIKLRLEEVSILAKVSKPVSIQMRIAHSHNELFIKHSPHVGHCAGHLMCVNCVHPHNSGVIIRRRLRLREVK